MHQSDLQICLYVLFLSLPGPADQKSIVERHKNSAGDRPSFIATRTSSSEPARNNLGSSSSDTKESSFSFSPLPYDNIDYWIEERIKLQNSPINGNPMTTLDVDTESDLFKQQSKEMFENLQYDLIGDTHQQRPQKQQQQLLPLPVIPHGPTKSYFDYPTSFWRSQPDSLASLGLEDIAPRSDNMLNQLSGESLAILGQIKSVNKESCRAKLFNQTIMLPGCESRVIKNRFCYGRCNSFYVPLDETQNQFRFKTCSVCKPIKSSIIEVRLKCLSSELKPTKRKVRVEKIESCRCVAESVSQKHSQLFRNV